MYPHPVGPPFLTFLGCGREGSGAGSVTQALSLQGRPQLAYLARSPSKGDRKRLARVGFACIPVCSVFRRIRSRRGGGGVERGGDACIAPGGSTLPGLGDASIPAFRTLLA